MYYGKILKVDIANGPGMRVTLFVSGCRNCCPGCFNKDTWDFKYGQPYTEKEEEYILSELGKDYYQGLTILGGEPFEEENQPAVLELIQKVRERYGKTRDIWAFTGYTLDELYTRKHTEYTGQILSQIDCLVDGRFRMEEKDVTLRFRGSRNQRIIDMTKTKGTDVVLSEYNERRSHA